MTIAKVELNIPQARFLQMPHKFKAFVAGFGSGKTYVGCSSLGMHFMNHPGINAGYFAPTFPHIRDIFYPTIEEALEPWGLDVKINESNKEVHVFSGASYRGTVICRSMDRPESIIGFKIGHALIDEIDILKKQKAQLAWRKIIARMRYLADGLKNGIDVTTTPEGFNFVYSQFVDEIRKNPALASMYGMIQASTYQNAANLPEDYIPSLLKSYPAQLIEAYIHGQFVNLKTGTVYSSYDRRANSSSNAVLADDRILHIGMDFNVGKMAAIVHVIRDNNPHAVEEIVNAFDTPDMIRRIKERFWEYSEVEGRYIQNRQIIIYPDSSGDSRKSVNASETDIQLLKAAGFRVKAPNQNPPVKDRINSMNAMFCNSQGERRYFVNDKLCPTYADCLEQQAWSDSGEPDKSTGHDHPLDAAGYVIHSLFPIKSRRASSDEFLL